ncbi:hypothetical protein [Anaerobacterium chartisolvens]|nr:hypothetical protein [Anaerobacterium chartisolvens]
MVKIKTEKEKNIYRKYLLLFISISFGILWLLIILPYVLFSDFMVSRFGELDGNNPLAMIGLNSPAIPCLLIYLIYGGPRGLGNFLRTLIPRRKDLLWIPIILSVTALCSVSVRYILILFNLYVPEITMQPMEMLVVFLSNFWGETGMIGIGIGFYGFVLPYFQRKYKNNVKAGAMTGLLLGLLFFPSAPDIATCLLYVVQHIIFSVCISYILNDVGGNVLFYMLAMWVAGAGGKLGLYEFNISVQIVEILLYCVLFAILHFVFKSRNANKPVEEILQVFPDFIENRSYPKNKNSIVGA